MRYCTFIFSISCSIASVTSYFIGKKRLKIYKMAMSMLLKFLTLKCNISRTIWRIEVGDGSLFCISHALSFELNFFSDRRFPLNQGRWHLVLSFLLPGLNPLCSADFSAHYLRPQRNSRKITKIYLSNVQTILAVISLAYEEMIFKKVV